MTMEDIHRRSGDLPPAGRLVAAFLSLIFVTSCAGSSDAPRSLSFDPTSDKAIVLVGTSVSHRQTEEVKTGRSFSTFWQEYDPRTLQLVPGGETFVTTVAAGPFSAELAYTKPTVSVLEVEPGAYALVGAGFPHLASTFVESKKASAPKDDRGRFQTWTYTVDPRRHIDPEAKVDRRGNFLFSVSAGEILYIGHIQFLKWGFSDSIRSLDYSKDEAAARAVLAEYPKISGIMVTFDPTKPPQSVFLRGTP